MRAEVGHCDQPWAGRLMPYLDGQAVPFAFAADDEAGVVWQYAPRWNYLRGRWEIYAAPCFGARREIPIRELRGAVELRRDADNKWAACAHLPIGSRKAFDDDCERITAQLPVTDTLQIGLGTEIRGYIAKGLRAHQLADELEAMARLLREMDTAMLDVHDIIYQPSREHEPDMALTVWLGQPKEVTVSA